MKRIIFVFLLLVIAFNVKSQQIILKHKYYTNYYNLKYNITDSVKYTLTKQLVNGNIKRTNRFVKDPLLKNSPVKSDYTNSGYSRGHTMPAADCAGDSTAMKECFYMSAMTPQIQEFNAGIWKQLENLERELTNKPCNDSLVIVISTLYNNDSKTISKKKITVPEAFKKKIIIYPKREKLLYLIPNDNQTKDLSYFKK